MTSSHSSSSGKHGQAPVSAGPGLPASASRPPEHLPDPWQDQAGYDAFCRLVNPLGDYGEFRTPWREVRIPPGLSAGQVYRRLPWDMKYEFAGYLTRTRIRYRRCGRTVAYMPRSRACTFHSHPQSLFAGPADLPSASDVRSFLLGRNWRTITVGRLLLWVWDKTEATLEVVRRLAAWEQKHMTREVRRLEAEKPDRWADAYVTLALRRVGLDVPDDDRLWGTVWPERLRSVLGLKVTIFERD